MHEENFGVYGVENIWRQLNREGIRVGRDRVARLMRELNLEGAVRGKRKRTTVASELDQRPADLRRVGAGADRAQRVRPQLAQWMICVRRSAARASIPHTWSCWWRCPI